MTSHRELPQRQHQFVVLNAELAQLGLPGCGVCADAALGLFAAFAARRLAAAKRLRLLFTAAFRASSSRRGFASGKGTRESGVDLSASIFFVDGKLATSIASDFVAGRLDVSVVDVFGPSTSRRSMPLLSSSLALVKDTLVFVLVFVARSARGFFDRCRSLAFRAAVRFAFGLGSWGVLIFSTIVFSATDAPAGTRGG